MSDNSTCKTKTKHNIPSSTDHLYSNKYHNDCYETQIIIPFKTLSFLSNRHKNDSEQFFFPRVKCL